MGILTKDLELKCLYDLDWRIQDAMREGTVVLITRGSDDDNLAYSTLNQQLGTTTISGFLGGAESDVVVIEHGKSKSLVFGYAGSNVSDLALFFAEFSDVLIIMTFSDDACFGVSRRFLLNTNRRIQYSMDKEPSVFTSNITVCYAKIC